MDRKYIHQYVLAYVIIAGFVGLTSYVLHMVHTGMSIQDSTGSVFMLMGSISTAFGIIVQYFFGSTRSSGEKTQMIADLSKKQGESNAPGTPVGPAGGSPGSGPADVQDSGVKG